MTWIGPVVLIVVLAALTLSLRRLSGERLRQRIAGDAEVGRSIVRAERAWVGRVLMVFLIGGWALGGVRLLVAGQPVGLLWLVAVGFGIGARREFRRLAGRAAELLDEPAPVTAQDRIRDRFSAAYAVVALVSLSIGQVLVDGRESDGGTWRLAVAFGLLAVTLVAGLAAMWSQAWVFSERRWSRGG